MVNGKRIKSNAKHSAKKKSFLVISNKTNEAKKETVKIMDMVWVINLYLHDQVVSEHMKRVFLLRLYCRNRSYGNEYLFQHRHESHRFDGFHLLPLKH